MERALRPVINLDLFGVCPRFIFELPGGYDEVEERDRRLVDGGREGPFLKHFEPVTPGVFTGNGAVFLFEETIVVFLAVADAGEGELFVLHRISE
ncbi:MAG: hypothetical protein LBB48_09405, partial [Treponema sp.]|nr:hypothetical protein [Treponema sp.]